MTSSNIADNKKFWQTAKHIFPDKINHKETTNLFDKRVTLSNDEKILETFNKYFCNIVRNFSLPENPSIKELSVEPFTNPLKDALDKY